MKKNQIVIYKNGEIELNIKIGKESIWLTQKDIALLFEKDRSVITKHINKIFKDKEVDEKSNVQILHISGSDKPVKFYSLDIVLAVGYRTNSAKAIQFRKWATKVLKEYIYQGYAINSEKITHQRFKELENDVNILKQKVKLLEKQNIIPTEGIFFDGQIFDAYKFVSNLIRSAKNSIVVIDNYVDDTVLTLLTKRNEKVKATIYTSKITKQLHLDLKKHNAQYPPIEIKELKNIHDRFLIIDNRDIYHIGASLKDLGKKVFAFSKMDKEGLKILERLGNE